AADIIVFFFQAEDGIRDLYVTGVQTCALPISWPSSRYCLPCAPKRPIGTRMPLALSLAHHSSRVGMIHSNGTSTLLARTASSPRSEERRVGKECRSRWARLR